MQWDQDLTDLQIALQGWVNPEKLENDNAKSTI